MRVTYDATVDAAYIRLKDDAPGGSVVQHVVEAPESQGEIILDFDRDGRLLGIEVLGATRGLPPELLSRAERL